MGNDTLRLSGAYDGTQMPISITSVETLQLLSDTGDAAVSLSNYTLAATGLTNIIFDNVASMNGRTITTSAGQSVNLGTGASQVATAG